MRVPAYSEEPLVEDNLTFHAICPSIRVELPADRAGCGFAVQQDRVLDLLDGNACTPDEWDQILKSVLLGGEPVKDVEAVATVDPGVKHGESITIHFRRRVSGINVSTTGLSWLRAI